MKWSEAIALGNMMIGETHTVFLDRVNNCGCAHAAGWAGIGVLEEYGPILALPLTRKYFPLSRVMTNPYKYSLGELISDLHQAGIPRMFLVSLIQEFEKLLPQHAEGIIPEEKQIPSPTDGASVSTVTEKELEGCKG